MFKRSTIIIAFVGTILFASILWWYLARPSRFIATDNGNTTPTGGNPFFSTTEPATPTPPTATPPRITPTPSPVVDTTPLVDGSIDNKETVVLRTGPVAGAILVESGRSYSGQPFVLLLERETGAIIKIDLPDREAATVGRLPNIAPINKASFFIKGSRVGIWFETQKAGVAEYWEAGFDLASMDQEGAVPEITLRENTSAISHWTVSPNGEELLILEAVGGHTEGWIIGTDGGRRRAELNFPLTQWLVEWLAGNTWVLTSKPSSQTPGYSYLLRADGKRQKVLDGLNGLTTLTSPDGKWTLYTQSARGGVETSILDLSKETDKKVSLNILPGKCVWTADSSALYCAVSQTLPFGNYPDKWLLGGVGLNDSIWKIEPESGFTKLVLDGIKGEDALDILNLVISKDGKQALFIDQATHRLFLTSLNDVEEASL